MFEKEISNGIELLNRINPGWVDKINLNIFRIDNCYKCIIGQLYGTYYDYTIHFPNINPYNYCFIVKGDYAIIATDEWKEAITNLRSNNNILQSDILDSIPEKLYSKEEVKLLLEDVMNIGMNLRQDQITGNTKRTGREVLEEFIKTKL